MRRNIYFLVALLCFCVGDLYAQKLNMDKFKGMELRSIGPAGMSGRVTCIDVIHEQPDVIYIGSGSGGVWKSENGGISWKPIFDDQGPMSIGAIAIDQSNPDVVWVGTGEGNPRNSQSSGKGVYKSLDGGKTWKFLGLPNTRNIHRIFIHPKNSDVVFLGVQGSAWGDSKERGVYKTTDGGKTWKKILYVNEKTGVGDMVIDPSNPDKLIVAMWEFRREPWFFTSGGKGSGLHVTLDGGNTWKKLSKKEGLPKGDLGRIGLAIAPSNPNRIYALVESKKNALYQSIDGGMKWTKVSDKNIGTRPFYYADIFVDPINELRIYNLYSMVSVSNDGGKTFEVMLKYDRSSIHPDHHAWWIHPKNPSYILNGNDGGLAISRDRGKTWKHVENLPLAQFYHINVDMKTPYNVMGGMQDNGSWVGPAYAWRSGGIRNSYWQEVSFGDGFDVVADKADSDYVFTMWQGGNLLHSNIKTGRTSYIAPTTNSGAPLRFHWNAGIATSPMDNQTIYYGSQFLHKSEDRGKSWKTISPDLTTNDPEKQKQLKSGGLTFDITNAENHTTIISIAPSPLNKNVIWVGTDDGNVQVTQDAGKTWKNTSVNIKGVPKGSWVAQIKASDYNEGEAVAVINNYRRNDWTPYLYRTTNFGKSWSPLVKPSQVDSYVLSFVQDKQEPKLMFLGTEFGLYVSIDAGANWAKWKHGYPTVSTIDLVIHPREHDLVVGTFGRAAYVLDDIRPLRELAKTSAKVLDKNLHAFNPPKAYQVFYQEASGLRFMANGIFQGKNRPYGAMLTYYLKSLMAKKGKDGKMQEAPESDTVRISIKNSEGKVIRNLISMGKVGINRMQWDLSQKGVRFPNTPKPKKETKEPSGRSVMPGTYEATFYYKKDSASVSIEVLADPRMKFDKTEMNTLETYLNTYTELVSKCTKAADQLRDAEKFLKTVQSLTKGKKDLTELATNTKAMSAIVKKMMKSFKTDENIQGYYRDTTMITYRLNTAGFWLQMSGYQLNQTQTLAFERVQKEGADFVAKVNGFIGKEWEEYMDRVKNSKLSFFPSIEEVK